MMAATSTPPWDAQTDDFITTIDDITVAENNISIRDLLLNPGKYINDKDIEKKIHDVKDAANSFFSTMLKDLAGESERLTHELESADLQYKKISELITTKATAAKVPFIKPSYIYIVEDLREEIVIDQYNESIDHLVGKLVNGSNYVADLSGRYKNYALGSWLFSGAKPYVLTIRPPTSMIMNIERSSEIINQLLDGVSENAKALAKP